MYLFIDSSNNQDNGDDNANVRIEFNDRIVVDTDTPVTLESMEIANSIYNVSTNNNKLELDSSAVTLSPGSYTLADLMLEIDTKLTASNSHDFTISYSDTTSFMTIASATGNFSLDFDVTDSCADLLGFSRSSTYSSAQTYTGSKVPQLNDKIFIHVDQFTSPYICSDSKHPSFIIDNDQARHDIVFYKKQTSDGLQCDCKQNFSSLNIRLRDRNGNLLENCPVWQMVLKIGY